VSFAEIASVVEKHAFSVHSYRERLPILMENCLAECDRGRQLCSFKRMSYLAIFSLPADVPQAGAHRAFEIALERFAALDQGPWPTVREQQFVLYRAFLGPMGALSITQHVINGVSRSYLQFARASQLPKSASSTKGQQQLYSTCVVQR
jgi:hypothetical protein